MPRCKRGSHNLKSLGDHGVHNGDGDRGVTASDVFADSLDVRTQEPARLGSTKPPAPKCSRRGVSAGDAGEGDQCQKVGQSQE